MHACVWVWVCFILIIAVFRKFVEGTVKSDFLRKREASMEVKSSKSSRHSHCLVYVRM